MSTGKIALKTSEQFMSDYTPLYQPIYPLFLGKSQQYPAVVGKTDFRRVQAVGDIRGKYLSPKDSEIRQISVMNAKKSYRAYMLANQYVTSIIQDNEGMDEVITQVLDEHQLQADELFLTGDGTSAGTVLNNGLFYSGDYNYSLLSSYAIPSATRISSFFANVVSNAQDADQLAGRKVIFFYGTDILPLYNSIFTDGSKPFKSVLSEVLGPNFSFVAMPKAVTPSGAHGVIIANLDQCKLHYTKLPSLIAQNINEEKMYYWSNFMLGSMMLEVLALNGVIHQPMTLGA